jgi:RNA polymerase sigma-70 factor, ECF subfamily
LVAVALAFTGRLKLALVGASKSSRTLGGFATCGIFPRQTRSTAPGWPFRGEIMTKKPDAAAPTPADTDLMLVERTVAGDQKAYELLVLKYQRRIERLIGRMVRDTDLVEDIAQETFIRAYRALSQFRGEAQFYTWLYRIAVNTAKKALVDLKRDPLVSETALRGGDEEDETSTVENELTTAETPETVLAAKEIAAAVNSAMEALPDELRQAVSLREIEGLSYEDIAEAMNCPIGTVRSRIFRAREAISARIKPLLENQSGKRW